MPRAPKLDFLTAAETAQKVGLSDTHVRRLCRDGIFPHAQQVGHLWLIPPGDIEKYMLLCEGVRNATPGRKRPYYPRIKKRGPRKE